jgi:hypothetical protein
MELKTIGLEAPGLSFKGLAVLLKECGVKSGHRRFTKVLLYPRD